MNDLLKAVRLTHLEKALPELLEQARIHSLTYDAFLRRVLLTEIEARKQQAQDKRLRAARLPVRKSWKTLISRSSRRHASTSVGISRTVVYSDQYQRDFAGSSRGRQNPSGNSTALSKHWMRDYSVLFTTLAHLAEDLASVPHPSLWRQRLRRYLTPRVLLIDEVGYTKLSAEQAHHLFDLITERYEKGSIILTSNTSFGEWGKLLNDEVLATALLDRLLHHAEVIAINGKSYRMKDRLALSKPTGGGSH